MRITKNRLLRDLNAIRILETNFPVFSSDGIPHERKTHYLLTNTPKERAFPQEEDQICGSVIYDLLADLRWYLKHSKPIKKATPPRGERNQGGEA